MGVRRGHRRVRLCHCGAGHVVCLLAVALARVLVVVPDAVRGRFFAVVRSLPDGARCAALRGVVDTTYPGLADVVSQGDWWWLARKKRLSGSVGPASGSLCARWRELTVSCEKSCSVNRG